MNVLHGTELCILIFLYHILLLSVNCSCFPLKKFFSIITFLLLYKKRRFDRQSMSHVIKQFNVRGDCELSVSLYSHIQLCTLHCVLVELDMSMSTKTQLNRTQSKAQFCSFSLLLWARPGRSSLSKERSWIQVEGTDTKCIRYLIVQSK